MLKEFNFRCTVKVRYFYARASKIGNEIVKIESNGANERS